jgi:uncharacterized SAM-binding protein YcdF (DUF218 family)
MMFFILSKTLGFLAYPSNVLMLMALLGLGLAVTRFRRAGLWLMGLSAMLLAIAGWSPLGNIVIYPLEQRFLPWDASRGPPDGIIVLGGAVSPELSAARKEPHVNEAAERLIALAVLARQYPQARLVYSGGSSGLILKTAMEADHALALLARLGIPRERIVIERRSRNTAENATFTKALVQPKPGERWLLVTSAAHMPRSVGIFRKQGFMVEAFPVDWRTEGTADMAVPFHGLSAGLARFDTAMHEWIGLVAYWVAGKTSALFPGPGAIMPKPTPPPAPMPRMNGGPKSPGP